MSRVSRITAVAAMAVLFGSLTTATRAISAAEPVDSTAVVPGGIARHLHAPAVDAASTVVVEQTAAPRDCDQVQALVLNLRMPGISLRLSNADIAPDSAGVELCLFEHEDMNAYSAWATAAKTVEEFRAVKQRYAPLLAAAGVDPCRIGFWIAFDRALSDITSPKDEHDAGQRCEPELVLHDDKARARGDQLRRALATSITKGEELFGRPNTWPLRIHVWGDNTGFVIGSVNLGAKPGNLAFESGVAMVSNLALPVIVMDLSSAPRADDATVLIAHEYAHILQHSVVGCSCSLPFFAVEGGAEYFASLVAGAAQPQLSMRFQVAKGQAIEGKATPLSDLVERRDTVTEEPYTRGYAAMHYLDARWGAGTFARLYTENADGTPSRYMEALTRLTGMDLNGFDRGLSEFLRTQRGFALPPGPNTTLRPDSHLLRLFTAQNKEAEDEVARFGGQDTAVILLTDWDCLPADTTRETVFFEPSGRRYATARSNRTTGCHPRSWLEFGLDDANGGPAPRSLPGTWKVEVYANGAFQGSVTFTIGG